MPTTPPHQEPRLELSASQQASMVRRLQAHCLHAQADAGTEASLIETHISYVLLVAGRAYKFKKAIRNAFLDNTSLRQRRQACCEELRLNRRLAPDLYLGVVSVTGSLAQPRLGGPGPVLDVAVEMLAFAQDGLWDRMARRGELGAEHVDALVQQLVPFHRLAAVAPATGPLGTPEGARAPLLENLRDLAPLWAGAAPSHSHSGEAAAMLQQLTAWEQAAHGDLRAVMAQRLAEGRVRECHGDLHLGNVAQIDGRSTVFDGIEFNDEFRWIDVMSELAFMAMDLHAHALPALAHRLVNAYLELAGDQAGVAVLSYYLVHRALVRAKVELMRAAQARALLPEAAPGRAASDQVESAWRYLALALQFSRAGRPVLMITHGLSGSGKTTLTQPLLEACGAIRLRADVERKRLAGLGALQRSDASHRAELYGEAMTDATYARLFELAVPVLQSGRAVILDATFLHVGQRDAARRLARLHGVPFRLLHFDAPPDTLRERIRQRARSGADASDADLQVLALQMAQAEPLQPQEQGEVFCMQGDWAALLAWLQAPDAQPG